MTALSL